MIYGRGGDVVTLVRAATKDDLWKHERRRADKQDAERFGYGMLWMVRYVKDAEGQTGSPIPPGFPGDDPEEWPTDLAFLKADNGWAEIDDARKALVTPEQYAEWTGMPV